MLEVRPEAGALGFQPRYRRDSEICVPVGNCWKKGGYGEHDLRRKAHDFSGDFPSLVTELKAMREKWNIPAQFVQGLNSEDFYDEGSAATYLLWRYENYLRSKPGQQAPRLEWDTIVEPRTT